MRGYLQIKRIFLILISIWLLPGCTKKTPTPADTLIFALSASPKTLDPRYSTDADGQRINGLLFNALVKVAPDLEIVGDFAKNWKFKNNSYVFTLNTGITFSDGSPVTAEDILYTFKFYQSDKSPFKSGLQIIKDVKVDFTPVIPTLTLKVEHYSASLLVDLTLIKILPKKTVEQFGDDFNRHLVGTGPFKFVSQNSNEIVLEARQDHILTAPKIKNVVFKIIQDDNTRYLQTIKGNIDIVQSGIPLSKIKNLENRKNFQVYKYIGASMNYLLLNFKDPIFKNKYVREALQYAINRKEIIAYKLEELAQPATSLLSPNNPFFNSELKAPDYDIDKAKDLMKLSGLKNVELTLKTSNNQEIIEIGNVLVFQLEKIGIKVKLQSYEWGTFYDDIKKGNFQIAMMRWIGTFDPDIYRVAFHSLEVPPGRNRGSYSNKELDKMLDEGLLISDQKKRIEHYKKIQKIIYDDLAIIPLWYNTQIAVVSSRIKNYLPSLLGDFSPAVLVSKE